MFKVVVAFGVTVYSRSWNKVMDMVILTVNVTVTVMATVLCSIV